MHVRNKARLKLLLVILLAAVAAFIANPKPTGVGWLDAVNGKFKINLGPDLQGGVILTYQAEMTGIEKGKEADALSGVRSVIERRVNAYGVAEAKVQASNVGDNYRINIELPGVKDIEQAKKMIKETPFLEFREEAGPAELTPEQLDLISSQNQQKEEIAKSVLQKVVSGEDFAQLAKDNSDDVSSKEKGGDLDFVKKGSLMVPQEIEAVMFDGTLGVGQVYPALIKTESGLHIVKKLEERGEGENREIKIAHILFEIMDPELIKTMLAPEFKPSGLTGKELKSAQLSFDPQTNRAQVSILFNDEGRELFKDITERNIGKSVAIFLDNQMISSPVVQDVIRNGQAVINGDFTVNEAKELASRLNEGALPVPITLISQQSVGASLGKASLDKSLKAGMWGLAIVAFFMVLYYRLAGLVAVLALVIYSLFMVAVFKISSVTPVSIFLTLSGIAGFILSIGMAVDANILIFERMKEEIRGGRSLSSALDEGFRRAWPSIRDGNYSTIITCVILMIFGIGFIKGFALVLLLGVLMSMFTAIVVTRILMNAVIFDWFEKHPGLMLGLRKKAEK